MGLVEAALCWSWSLPGRRRAGRLAALLPALALALTACAAPRGAPQAPPAPERRVEAPPPGIVPAPPPPASSRFEGKTVVALLLPLSGQYAETGNAMLYAANLAVSDLGGDSFLLLPRDTRGTPDGAATAAREAVDAGARLILGPLLAGNVSAAASAVRGSGVNIIGFSNDRSVAGNGVFLMGFLPDAEVRRVIGYAAKQGMRRYGVLAPETSYGRLVARATEAAAARHGGAVPRSATVGAAAGQAELEGAAGALASAGPFDGIMVPLWGEPLNRAAAALAAAGMGMPRTRLLGTSQWDQPTLSAEPALVGGWFAAPPPQTREEFARRYADTYGSQPPRVAALAYDATALAVALANQPGGTNYDVRALMTPRGFVGADGFFRFVSDGTAERGLAVMEVTPGGLRVVDPAPMRAEELIF